MNYRKTIFKVMDIVNADSVDSLESKIQELKKSYFMALGLSMKLVHFHNFTQRVRNGGTDTVLKNVSLSDVYDACDDDLDTSAYQKILEEAIYN